MGELAAWEAVIGDGPDELVIKLNGLRKHIADCRMLEGELVDFIADCAPAKQFEVEGVGMVEVRHAKKGVKWDMETLVPRIVSRAWDEVAVDQATGELLERPEDAVVRALRECVAFSYARVGALKERGIDPDEYRESQGFSTSVVIA